MYRSINVSEETYQRLNKIATQQNKPKSQVVESLVKEHSKNMEKQQKSKLDQFNKEMREKIRVVKFSKKIKVNTDNIDEDFVALANTDYIS